MFSLAFLDFENFKKLFDIHTRKFHIKILSSSFLEEREQFGTLGEHFSTTTIGWDSGVAFRWGMYAASNLMGWQMFSVNGYIVNI